MLVVLQPIQLLQNERLHRLFIRNASVCGRRLTRLRGLSERHQPDRGVRRIGGRKGFSDHLHTARTVAEQGRDAAQRAAAFIAARRQNHWDRRAVQQRLGHRTDPVPAQNTAAAGTDHNRARIDLPSLSQQSLRIRMRRHHVTEHADAFRDRSDRFVDPFLQLAAQDALIARALRNCGRIRLRFRSNHGHVELGIAVHSERDTQVQGVTARRGSDVTYKDSTGWNWHGVLLNSTRLPGARDF